MGINIGTTGVDEIYVGEGKLVDDYSAMQGPCPEGFHVPSVDEWQEVYDIWGILGGGSTDGTNFGITLKLPFAGDRPRTNGNSSYQGTFAVYWSSTAYNNSNAYDLYFSPTGITPKDKDGYSNAFSIRAFKDVSVTPTNSWLKLYGTSIEAGGIFWSANDGLISLSSDGTTWVTISDKNLGATAVYNNGDTLSEANCGKYFQWGNNYGFPRTGTITISSTQANASNYGPGNYYSSSIFITRTSSPYNWSNVRNDNLRGGETGVQQKQIGNVTEVYVGTTKIRPVSVYNGPELCFTANISNSTVQLIQQGSPTVVTLETSTDGNTWTTYTMGDTITLTNIGDKVYWRNTSETSTGFGTGSANYYRFNLTGSLNASGDVTSLINKDCTDTLVSQYSFARLFYNSSNSDVLKTSPKLSATNLTSYCYYQMFNRCTGLVTLPELPATTLTSGCYYQTFARCSGIKLSETQTGEYQTSYRIPTSGTGTTATNALYYTFMSTGGTWTGGTPTINATYYTSNTVV